MNVKLTFKERNPRTLGGSKQPFSPPYDWLNYFGRLTIKVLEPCCPFCGNYLNNAYCSCSQYHEALRRFLATYGQDMLHVQLYDIEMLELVFINESNVTMTPVEFSVDDLPKFDKGTVASEQGFAETRGWHVSEGVFDNGSLTFLIRKQGQTKVFQCRIDGVEKPKELPQKVKIYYLEENFEPMSYGGERRLGGYRIGHETKVVDEIPYEVFLQKLTEFAE